jgi:hypothetical protein
MSAKGRGKKDDKPPPATGPGSKIIALPEPLRKNYLRRLDGKKVQQPLNLWLSNL